MSYCLNPNCPQPQNTSNEKFCLHCGSKLLLKERYRAIQPIGQGGFGRTFLARDEDKPSKPYCVIKQLYPQAQGTSTLQKAAELFTQEAMRLDELGKHPQIPELLAYFTQGDRQYLVQEFINGYNLTQELAQNGAFQEQQILELLQDLLPVLEYCHLRQVIHRDIKPENIIHRIDTVSSPQSFQEGGNLFLVDFGAAKVATYTALNRTGTSIGSPEYVAPEQMRGKAIFASDIYSLGVTCIHLLTGHSPFDIYDVNHGVWIWQKYIKNPVSKKLVQILDKMLAHTPARRYQRVEEVQADLSLISEPISKPISQAISKAVSKSVRKKKSINPSSPVPPPAVQIPSNQKSQSQIDRELEEMKTIFLGAKPKNNSSNKSNSKSNSQSNSSSRSKDKIDTELDELKAKYLGNNDF
ncbi:MAG: serine/threonine-protein kinase [Mastigocoleus sp. MO_167.B18]|nr:serine/threonine-protein kinase [Mastigocoleus sp. MO_167.B18]